MWVTQLRGREKTVMLPRAGTKIGKLRLYHIIKGKIFFRQCVMGRLGKGELIFLSKGS